MKYLDAILRVISREEYTHREDVAIIISKIFEINPDISIEEFTAEVKKIKRDFFRINRLNRNEFSEDIFKCLKKIQKDYPKHLDDFAEAKRFIVNNFENGFNRNQFVEERIAIVNRFSEVKKPHDVLMDAFNKILDKILLSYSIDIHGVKEYSGIDISKKIESATIGFQIKTKGDDISEHMIRSETSKAQDYKMNGFVLIYGRKKNKKVDCSIQAAYHHFKFLNESKRIYCTIITPEFLAESLRVHSIMI